jgi:lactoylglutathione lyase
MPFLHANLRIRDLETSLPFYEAIGFERRGRLQFDNRHYVYLGLPGDADALELQISHEPLGALEHGNAFDHIAFGVEDLDATVATLAGIGFEPEAPPYHPNGKPYRVCFFRDPDGHRIELIDDRFATPQDPAPQEQAPQGPTA